VATAVVLTAAVGDPTLGAPRYVLIALLGLAMGIQNAAARRIAVPDLTTTVLTLTIVGMSADGLFGGGPNSKVGRRLLSVLAMFLGALAGSLLVLEVSDALSIGVALVILCLIGIGAGALSRLNRQWVHAS
jgi:uncharacterized membrane protein YoaK (UPF0700 family)